MRKPLKALTLAMLLSSALFSACSSFSEAEDVPATADAGSDASGPDARPEDDASALPEEGGDAANRDSTRYYVFVTSAAALGSFAMGGDPGILADDFCQRAAVQGGLYGVYKAWLETQAITAAMRFGTATPPAAYFTTNDTLAFDLAMDPIHNPDKTPIHSIAFDEDGAPVGSDVVVWTGTPSKTGIQANCSSWMSAGAAQSGWVGDPNANDSSWTSKNTKQCTDQAHFYCFRAQ